ncbi:MAG: lysophospholipid acyltransferase family protein [Desulfobacterales bacterium]
MKTSGSYLQDAKYNAFGVLGKLFIDGLFSTAAIEVEGWEDVEQHFEAGRFLLAFWHSRLLLPSYVHKRLGVVVLVSQSRDGEIISRILHHQGQKTVRGSSTRGGLRALAGMIRTMKEAGASGAVTPDGPQGPRFRVKPGVMMVARKTGYPIIPISYSADKVKLFASWDRFMLPYPFSTCRLVYGRPMYVPRKAGAAEEEVRRIQLEEELNRITRKVDRYFHHEIV